MWEEGVLGGGRGEGHVAHMLKLVLNHQMTSEKPEVNLNGCIPGKSPFLVAE